MINLEIKSKETTNFTLRMPVEARFQLKVIAAKESRTVTNLINMVLKEYIEKYNKTKKIGAAKLIATPLKFTFLPLQDLRRLRHQHIYP